MRMVLVLFPVAMMKYPNKMNSGAKGFIFSSQFLVTTRHCRDITAAGARENWSNCSHWQEQRGEQGSMPAPSSLSPPPTHRGSGQGSAHAVVPSYKVGPTSVNLGKKISHRHAHLPT